MLTVYNDFREQFCLVSVRLGSSGELRKKRKLDAARAIARCALSVNAACRPKVT